ncbi:MAG: 2-oxo acid dehydrogenase subunit E2 [Alphaproteobacteria bacterium]|nr:2-oxo acid dehydrogenase subunit E2 [Alphaproteobacteria bacterium]
MDVIMPQLGETVKEGAISQWFKKPGDKVAAGDNLFEIETDKVSMEVQAIESGVLVEILVPAGASASVGAVVGVIGDGKSKPAPRAPTPAIAAPPPVAASKIAPAPLKSAPPLSPHAAAPSLEERGFAPFNEVFTPVRNFGPARLPDGMRISPLARRLISQGNLDVNAIAAQVRSAGRTKISARDLQGAATASSAITRATVPLVPITGERDIVTLNRVRAQTAKHLQNSWQNVPHVLQTMEIDFGAVDDVRLARKEAFRASHGVSLTYLPFIARAVCLAIRKFPHVNAAFDGGKLHVAREINIGFAVDMNHNGLVVPVLKNADGFNVAELASAIAKLAEKARAGQLTLADMEGGTYSITNNGAFGTLFTAPLINAPQVAILSTDAIRKRALVKESPYGDVIVVRPAGILAQSFDHRAFDGAYSAAFLTCLKDIIETRDWASEFA